MSFIRRQVRLHTDIYDAYRYLTNTARIEKWYDNIPTQIEGTPFTQVTWHFKNGDIPERTVFHIMKCGSKTEYCTEVHAILPLDLGHQNEEWIEDLLERLRQHYNRDWVISESDILTDLFKGSL